MAFSEYDLSEAEHADALHAHTLRSVELADDLKCRIAQAVRQWLYVNDVQLDDPMWNSFGARSQETLETLIIGRLNDCCDDVAGDFLGAAK